jgi:hypothetical protein
MGPIILDVNNFNTLYEAWTACKSENIEGYDSQDVAQSMYLSAAKAASAREQISHPDCLKEQLPSSLIFSLNRVQYD